MSELRAARRLADAVLYEGYVLYPYRASAAKNKVRWQWGVLMPPEVAEADPSERAASRTDVVVDGRADSVRVTVRFLQVQQRYVEDAAGERVERLESGDAVYVPWDEAREQEVTLDVPLTEPTAQTFEIPRGTEVEEVAGGRLVRVCEPLRVRVEAGVRQPPAPSPVTVVSLRVGNVTPLAEAAALRREEWLRHALVACHLLVEVERARFLSLLDAPQWAQSIIDECEHDGVFPVLAAPDDRVVLSSPIILYDHAEVSASSVAASETGFFDSLEIDELLSLRTMTLTEEEKREVRGTDPRAAALLGDVDALPDELWERLHGTVSYLEQMTAPRPGDEAVTVAGVEVRVGSRVLLRPGVRRADAHDLFFAGREATVAAVVHDVDGHDHLAVTIDDDPGAELKIAHGRYLYFAPDEVEPITQGATP